MKINLDSSCNYWVKKDCSIPLNCFFISNFIRMSETPKIFTLKQVVSSVRKTIEERYQKFYWVKAEMHKLNKFASGHCFPELLQKENGKIVAQISGTIWSQQFERINKRFIEVVKEPLKEDSTLLMQVKVTFHEIYGLSLHIMDIDPNYALGELQRERQETLKRLQQEGLLNANQKLDFPLLPKRVAIISADSSKGLSDFMQVLDQNQWGYSVFTMLFHAYVQGDNATSSIIQQLDRIRRVKDHFDIVVIVRGGGGEVGLSCYNNYDLCASIATFPLPILTGIGHSTNLTVAEMIAYRNAITPTELGDFILQAFHNFSVPLKDAVKTIKHYSLALMAAEKIGLKNLSRQFKNTVQHSVLINNQLLRTIRQEIKSTFKFVLRDYREQVRKNEQRVYQDSINMLSGHRNRINKIVGEIPLNARTTFIKQNAELEQLIQSVRLMDPINVLNRGFSITTLNGKTLSETNKANPGDIIITKTAIFSLESEVLTTNKLNNE